MKGQPNLINLIAQQISLLKDLECGDWVTALSAVQNRLQDEQFNLTFVGEYSRGKSTLLNALLGHELLAASAIPVPTANRIKRSDYSFATAWTADGQQQSVPISTLLDADYSRLEIGYPAPWLPTNVTLIEQPTLEKPDVFTQAVTEADQVVMVVASDSLYSVSEQQAFEHIKSVGHRTVLFVCSCCDRIPTTEAAKLQEAAYVRLPVNPDQIFFLRAEQALQGNPQAQAEVEKFKQALLSRVVTDEQIVKQQRAQWLLQQSITVAKTTVREYQTVNVERQSTAQKQRRELQLAYEDTAALGRQLEAELSDFRQRTGEVVQTMTQTFIRKLAQETAHWLETPDTPLSQIAIEKHLRSRVQCWQQQKLEPYLRSQLSYQAKDLQTQGNAFNRQLQGLYQRLGTVESAASLTLTLGDIPLDELRFKVEDPPLPPTDQSTSSLFDPSNLAISLAVVAATLLVIRPFFLAIPASVAALGATTLFSSLKRSQSRQLAGRRQVAYAYEQAIRCQADPVSLQILHQIHDRLDGLQGDVRSHLNACLTPIKQYLQKASTLSANTDGSAYQQRIQNIEQTFRTLLPTE